MKKYSYTAEICDFNAQSNESIISEMMDTHSDLDRDKVAEIVDCIKQLTTVGIAGTVVFDYAIPYHPSRADVVIIINGVGFVIMFDCGSTTYSPKLISDTSTIIWHLKKYHMASKHMRLVPIVVSTSAPSVNSEAVLDSYGNLLADLCNSDNLIDKFSRIPMTLNFVIFDVNAWLDSPYSPQI